jgi:hypothetical protein
MIGKQSSGSTDLSFPAELAVSAGAAVLLEWKNAHEQHDCATTSRGSRFNHGPVPTFPALEVRPSHREHRTPDAGEQSMRDSPIDFVHFAVQELVAKQPIYDAHALHLVESLGDFAFARAAASERV